jgi:hypothetical protein
MNSAGVTAMIAVSYVIIKALFNDLGMMEVERP